MMMTLSDVDYLNKWELPKAPTFTEVSSVAPGDSLFVVIFFSNPKLNKNKEADVLCDFKITKPDGSLSMDSKGVPCYVRPVAGNPKNIFMSDQNISFHRDPKDPTGVWKVDVNVIDKNAGATVALKSKFTLK